MVRSWPRPRSWPHAFFFSLGPAIPLGMRTSPVPGWVTSSMAASPAPDVAIVAAKEIGACGFPRPAGRKCRRSRLVSFSAGPACLDR